MLDGRILDMLLRSVKKQDGPAKDIADLQNPNLASVVRKNDTAYGFILYTWYKFGIRYLRLTSQPW